MPDMTCKQCGEPWDTMTIRHELFEGDPQWEKPENMPNRIKDLYYDWMESDPWSKTGEEKRARELLFKAVYDGGLGDGCPACWYDPERVMDERGKYETMHDSILFDAWDGDPMTAFDLMIEDDDG